MRMARVNITLPDDLLNQARAAGLNVSRLAAAALAEELDRRAKLRREDFLNRLDVVGESHSSAGERGRAEERAAAHAAVAIRFRRFVQFRQCRSH